MEQLPLPVHDSRQRFCIEFPCDYPNCRRITGRYPIEVEAYRVCGASGRRQPFNTCTHSAKLWRGNSDESPSAFVSALMPLLYTVRATYDASGDPQRIGRSIPGSRTYLPVFASGVISCSIIRAGGPCPVDHEDHGSLLNGSYWFRNVHGFKRTGWQKTISLRETSDDDHAILDPVFRCQHAWQFLSIPTKFSRHMSPAPKRGWKDVAEKPWFYVIQQPP